MEALTERLAMYAKYAGIVLSLGSVLLIIIVLSKYFIGLRTSLPNDFRRFKLKLAYG